MPIPADVLAAFVLACIVLAVTPGPAMSLILATTTTHGFATGLVTVLGNATGMSILLAVVCLGMTSVVAFLAEWFEILRWIGAAYLIWLGASRLVHLWRTRGGGLPPAPVRPRRRVAFLQGMLVAVSNPKVILFLAAFLPQFIDPTRDPLTQSLVLAIAMVLTLGLVDLGYAYAVGRARERMTFGWMRYADGLTSGLLIAGGVWLALSRRP
ncbi:MAG: LysE family translocator [Rhizobiales bacterium]|nr:LysE family translocator [Hyphomicrobiales bacterium]